MFKRPKLCKGCRYGHTYWGAVNKQGKPVKTKFWCAARNCSPKINLKKCEYRREDN